jgi:hypothetical protein
LRDEEEFHESIDSDLTRVEVHPLHSVDFDRAMKATSDSPSEYGPCLYLGPKGQRCSRSALEGGYCATHRQGGPAAAARDPRRVLAAALTLLVILWPYVHDIISEILKWINSH